MSLELMRGLYEYHRWANRRLFDVTAGLGDEVARRAVGTQFSFPSLARMLGHLYGADWLWLERWKGNSPGAIPGADFATLAALRSAWDALEGEQQAFIAGLTPASLERVVSYRSTEGQPFRAPLGLLLQHVANHATHHRSEVATMLTMVSGSPPDTGVLTWELIKSGQLP